MQELRLLPALAFVALFSTQAHAINDHLKCFKIKDTMAKATYTADIVPSDSTFESVPPGCTIYVPPKQLCVDAEKSNVTPAPPGAPDGAATQPFLCYKLKCPRLQPTASLTDQFGTHSLTVKSTSLLCAPAAPPCTPTAEVCDGVDNDCNNSIDEGTTGLACSTGVPGLCSTGVTTCTSGTPGCSQTYTPVAELCDNADNDCDGFTDEGNPGGGMGCDTGQLGNCQLGTSNCSSGSVVCTPNQSPQAESCDNADNDCDGSTDEGTSGLPCNTGQLGICQQGTATCTSGMLSCAPNNPPQAETCNSLDDNCNGITDDGNPGGGLPCNTGLPGACAPGTTVCSGGTLICQQNVMGSPEICDGIDNNCNGATDEGSCLSNGSACTQSAQCSSFFCVDGFCCDGSCSGTCEACSIAKNGFANGVCTDIPNGQDPDAECPGSQVCDGSGSCL